MKSTSIAVCLFLGLAQASQYDNLIQIESESMNRATIRSTLQAQLRAALNAENPTNDSLIQVENQSNSEIRQQLQQQLRRCTYGDCDVSDYNHSWPAPILPGSAVIPYPNPAPSSNLDQALVQLNDADDTVEGARAAAAQMQAQMDAAVAEADNKRAQQQAQYEESINKNDPAAQLQGLMNAQQSLKRISGAFQAKPKEDKVSEMAKKLGIPMTPELMQLGSNEAISNALVEIAVGMGKTEAEISASIA